MVYSIEHRPVHRVGGNPAQATTGGAGWAHAGAPGRAVGHSLSRLWANCECPQSGRHYTAVMWTQVWDMPRRWYMICAQHSKIVPTTQMFESSDTAYWRQFLQPAWLLGLYSRGTHLGVKHSGTPSLGSSPWPGKSPHLGQQKHCHSSAESLSCEELGGWRSRERQATP